uniref:PUM-HD domain-containing protein n=1 Tax=Elaeophora elaphi TaxID=1147741 RepID=A0A0R3RHL0_9BILA
MVASPMKNLSNEQIWHREDIKMNCQTTMRKMIAKNTMNFSNSVHRMQAINIFNQSATVTHFRHIPTWPIESMNSRGYGYTVHLNSATQTSQISTSLVESNELQRISTSPVLYHSMSPYIIPLTNSAPPLTNVHGPDGSTDISFLPFPATDDAFVATIFTEYLIQIGEVDTYAMDKHGSRYLQNVFSGGNLSIRQKITDHFLQTNIFAKLCDDIFANFFLQKLIEETESDQHTIICAILETDLVTFSRGRYSCRVVQKALECFDVPKRLSLVNKLNGNEKDLTMDQNANHVIQKIFSCVPFYGYSVIVNKYMASTDVLNEIVKDRYGCRLIQTSIEKLEEEVIKDSKPATLLLEQLVNMLLRNCWSYSTHQYANYVVQHIIKSKLLGKYRNKIIRELLNNLLSMSQEKYASHVVEKALKYAPPRLLQAMMNEIFDGYECDKKGQDALDVLLFDQFGNYVVQTMLDIAVEAKEKRRAGSELWFRRLAERIIKSQKKLVKYSSGKKILEKLSTVISSDKNIARDENFDPSLKSLIVPRKFR